MDNTTNLKVLSWITNNCFFNSIEEYNNFMKSLYDAELPIVIEHIDPIKIKTNDIIEFTNRVRNYTGYDTEFRFYTCNSCNELHCIIVIDKPEVE